MAGNRRVAGGSRTAAANVRAAPRPRRKPRAKGNKPVTVRHYCQGIGDCHLLKFKKDDGSDYWMLIDCGVHSSVSGGSKKIAEIVEDIASVTGRLDVLVVTHEHWDHVSGFFTAAERFKDLEVGEVWMAWTENPADPQARDLDKFKQRALAALQMTSARLNGASGLSRHLSALRTGLDSVVGFNFGARGEKVRAARDAAAALLEKGKNGKKGKIPRYFEPNHAPITIDRLPLRIYVLGPPRDPKLLGLTERTGEMYSVGSGSDSPIARAMSSAFRMGDGVQPPGEDCSAPFDPNLGTELSSLLDPSAKPADGKSDEIVDFVRDHYAGPAKVGAPSGDTSKPKKPDPNETDQSWRRIDLDWMGVSADLAMQLDDRTNNTSLALAFEFVDTGRVLLFVGDAQVGNWKSWQDLKWIVDGKTVTGPDLLARTVYYKVGHHGSHNATLKEKGLELMTSKDLSSFIPTNEKDAKKVGWGAMPFKSILEELRKRGSGRVIRADDEWIATDTVDPSLKIPSGSIRALRHKSGLFVEVDVA